MSEASSGLSPRRTLSGWICAASWGVAIGLSYLCLDGSRPEGVDGAWKAAPLVMAAVLVALISTVVWARGASGRGGQPSGDAGIQRRQLLGFAVRSLGVGVGGAAGVVAAFGARNAGWIQVTGRALGAPTPTESPEVDPSWSGARIQRYRRLGRTGVMVSDISLGSASIRTPGGEDLARAALDRGVNYFDTAPDYSAEGSELALGLAMKGRRDEVFLATKFCTPTGHLPAGSPVSEYVRVVEDSLRRLQTDHVDLVHIHSCDTEARLMDENVHEAFDRLREQGKARFLGVSTHTPNLERVVARALASDRFDVRMLAYHPGAWPKLRSLIERAASADVGVVAMKTLKGAYHQGLLELTQQERRSYPQAAFRWVLADPAVSALVISFSKPQHLDEYLAASGEVPKESDVALLAKYDRLISGVHCMPHCGACLDACPAGLPIDDMLRFRMYFENYGDQKEAMRFYSALERKADACVGCSAPCASSCPVGVPIAQRLRETHAMLS